MWIHWIAFEWKYSSREVLFLLISCMFVFNTMHIRRVYIQNINFRLYAIFFLLHVQRDWHWQGNNGNKNACWRVSNISSIVTDKSIRWHSKSVIIGCFGLVAASYVASLQNKYFWSRLDEREQTAARSNMEQACLLADSFLLAFRSASDRIIAIIGKTIVFLMIWI